MIKIVKFSIWVLDLTLPFGEIIGENYKLISLDLRETEKFENKMKQYLDLT
jgi:hypothetical protein